MNRLVGSGAGTHLTLVDDTGSLPCWCSTHADPFALVRKGGVIEVDLVVQDADAVATEGDPSFTLTRAPEGRYAAITIRRAGSG